MSFCRALRFALALLLLGLLPGSLCAKTIRHYDQNGRSTGYTEIDSRGNARHYDQNGRYTGRSETSSDGTVRYYDRNGRSTGRATTSSDGTVRYYDQNGRSTGRTNGTLSPAQAGNPARR